MCTQAGRCQAVCFVGFVIGEIIDVTPADRWCWVPAVRTQLNKRTPGDSGSHSHQPRSHVGRRDPDGDLNCPLVAGMEVSKLVGV